MIPTKTYLHSRAHLTKLLGIYKLDLALVLDGQRPSSLAVSIWTDGMTQAQAQAFIEERIGTVVVRIMKAAEHDNGLQT